MKNVRNILFNIFVWVIIIAAGSVLIFTIVSVNTFNRNDRKIFGYSAYIVMSDSMSKTDFSAGDVVLIKSVDPATLQEGDIITFISRDKDNAGMTVTHKIRRAATDENGEAGFITYGTTTDEDDETMVTYSDILGKYQGHIPKIGSFFHFLKTVPGYLIFVLTPFALLLAFQGKKCVKAIREYRAEEVDEIRTERAKLEEERRRTEEAMMKLQEMEMRLGNNSERETAAEIREEEPLK